MDIGFSHMERDSDITQPNIPILWMNKLKPRKSEPSKPKMAYNLNWNYLPSTYFCFILMYSI